MEENKSNLDKLLSLSKEELQNVLSELTMSEAEDLLNKLKEVGQDE